MLYSGGRCWMCLALQGENTVGCMLFWREANSSLDAQGKSPKHAPLLSRARVQIENDAAVAVIFPSRAKLYTSSITQKRNRREAAAIVLKGRIRK